MTDKQEPAEKPLVQGWTYPTDSAKKAHWFSNRDLPGHRYQESLCGNYLMFAMDPAQVRDGARIEESGCVSCGRRLDTMVKLGHVVIGASTDERVGKDK